MDEMPARLLIAYGLIALMVAAAAAFAWWKSRNTRTRRDARARARLDERYRLRDETAASDR